MVGPDLQLLLIEDNPADARLIETMLKDGADVAIDWVQTLDEGVQRLTANQYDAVLLDLSLPDSHGTESVSTTHLFDTETPIIVLTGLDDDAAAFEALREGAQDYLIKGTIDGTMLLRTVRFARERVKVQRALAVKAADVPGGHEAVVRAVACAPGGGMLASLAPHLVQVMMEGPVAYVTFDRAGSVLQQRFTSLDVAVDGLHIIDASGQGATADGRIHVPDDVRDLDALSLEVELACGALGPGTHVIVDNINALILLFGIEAAAVFSHTLANRLRVLGIDADFAGQRNHEWPFILDRFSFVDSEVDLDQAPAMSQGSDPSIA